MQSIKAGSLGDRKSRRGSSAGNHYPKKTSRQKAGKITPQKISRQTQAQKGGRKAAIGIFDSGFGGLAVMRHVVKKLPQYNYIYLGDNARVPYGTRSPRVIHEFARQAVDFLFQKNCQLVIFACNTVSAGTLRLIQRDYIPSRYPGRNVLGIIIPAAEAAATLTKNKKVGVMATRRTVASKAFVKELKKINRKISVYQSACPLLVPIVEAGEHQSPATDIFLAKYLKPLLAAGIDTLVLGCTHYAVLEKKIGKISGKKIRIISEGAIVAEKLEEYLHRHPEIENHLTKNGRKIFYCTDKAARFDRLGSMILGWKIAAQKRKLGE